MSGLPIVAIWNPKGDGHKPDHVFINERDFDPTKHVLATEPRKFWFPAEPADAPVDGVVPETPPVDGYIEQVWVEQVVDQTDPATGCNALPQGEPEADATQADEVLAAPAADPDLSATKAVEPKLSRSERRRLAHAKKAAATKDTP